MDINNVVIVGSGLMGSGIAYVVANAKKNVTIVDQEQKFLDAGMSKIRGQIKDGISRNKMSPFEGEQLSRRFKTSLDLKEAVKTADLVIEAVYENMDVKQGIFKILSESANDDTILASNTSTLSISEIASVCKNPQRIVGLHFFSPVAAMKLVEVISGDKTDDNTINMMLKFVDEIGKTAVKAKNSPGFIVNRLLVPMLNEAVKLYDEGVASMEDIDRAAVLGASFPAGPFVLSDMVGLDIALASMRTLEKSFGECYKPSSTLIKRVEEGKLGMKTKEGFYKY